MQATQELFQHSPYAYGVFVSKDLAILDPSCLLANQEEDPEFPLLQASHTIHTKAIVVSTRSKGPKPTVTPMPWKR